MLFNVFLFIILTLWQSAHPDQSYSLTLIYIHTCTHACIHTYIHACMHTYIHTCMHAYIHTYIFVVVNFDALAQASDFRIERRQVVFLCWEQDSNPGGLWNPISSRLNACWQTDWAIEDQAIKLELDSPSPWSASIQPTWPHCHLAFAPGSGDKHICCC